MLPYLPGVAGFALFILYDFNKISLKNRRAALLYPIGALLLIFSTVWILSMADWCVLVWRHPFRLGIGALLAVGFLFLLVYALFFALPVRGAYVDPDGAALVENGVYALCRHPGVLLFLFFWLSLWLAAQDGRIAAAALLYSSLNALYVLLEDVFVFPKLIGGYGRYKKEIPFAIPSGASVKRFLRLKKANRAG